MKTKDIVTVLVAIVLIGGSGFLMYKMLKPTKKPTTSTTTQQTETKITGTIDEETLKLISEKKDYGEAALDNIGRTNPFGPLN